jgi:hypothetical protein
MFELMSQRLVLAVNQIKDVPFLPSPCFLSSSLIHRVCVYPDTMVIIFLKICVSLHDGVIVFNSIFAIFFLSPPKYSCAEKFEKEHTYSRMVTCTFLYTVCALVNPMVTGSDQLSNGVFGRDR